MIKKDERKILKKDENPVRINSAREDITKRDMEAVTLYLITNYTAVELSGAYINAMSGVTFNDLITRIRG